MRKIVQELKGKTIRQLEKEAAQLRTEIAKLRLMTKVSPGKDTNLIYKKRKRLAVILTLITEKKAMKELEKKEPNKG